MRIYDGIASSRSDYLKVGRGRSLSWIGTFRSRGSILGFIIFLAQLVAISRRSIDILGNLPISEGTSEPPVTAAIEFDIVQPLYSFLGAEIMDLCMPASSKVGEGASYRPRRADVGVGMGMVYLLCKDHLFSSWIISINLDLLRCNRSSSFLIMVVAFQIAPLQSDVTQLSDSISSTLSNSSKRVTSVIFCSIAIYLWSDSICWFMIKLNKSRIKR